MMTNNGLSKLAEETGEVQQIIGKMLQYPALQTASDQHPDGSVLRVRLQEEIGDALAAMAFVIAKLRLNPEAIYARKVHKQALFEKWDNEK